MCEKGGGELCVMQQEGKSAKREKDEGKKFVKMVGIGDLGWLFFFLPSVTCGSRLLDE
jgi:hypothetical protein